jgi:hypothetical protein
MVNGSYWTKFMVELRKKRRNMHTKFYDKGFDILQNIDDTRLTLQKHGKRPKDKIDRRSKCKHAFNNGSKKRKCVEQDELLDLSELGDD